MQLGVVTLLPEMLEALKYGITGRAMEAGIIKVACFNPRDEVHNVHRTVDDRPYGGGPGMVMQAPPLADSVKRAKAALGEKCSAKVIYVSPKGRPLTQAALNSLAAEEALIFVAGRYEGVDERFIEGHVDEMWSIGDYVLSGGELAVMVMIDAITRLLPGSLGCSDSTSEESFMQGVLEYPHYTRPAVYENRAVPEVLLSGDHKAINEWRRQQALGQTWLHRPDLLATIDLTPHENALLQAFKAAYKNADKGSR
jgi:tRNA (guanine37-N1)-methyltransferase